MQVESLKIKQPYTYKEIITKYESNEYSAELLLQHVLLLLKNIKEGEDCK